MGKLTKYLLIGTSSLVALIVATVIVLPMLIDPNDYKEEIITAVKDETGRDLMIPGDIRLSVFPWLGVRLGEVSFGNAPGFDQQPMAKIQSMDVHVKLLPLFRKEVKLGFVTLRGLALRLARNADGRTNWDDLVAEPKLEEPEPVTAPTDGFAIESLEIGGIELSDSEIVWTEADATYQLSDVSLTTGRMRPGEAFLVNLAGKLASAKPQLNADIGLAGEMLVDIEASHFAARGLRINVLAEGEAIPNGRQQAELFADAELKLNEQQLKVTNGRLQGVGATVVFDVAGAQVVDAPTFSGRVDIKPVDLKAMLKTLAIDAPATADDAALRDVGMTGSYTATESRVAVTDLNLNLDGSVLKGSLAIDGFDTPLVKLRLQGDTVNADRYLPPDAQTAEARGNTDSGADEDINAIPIDVSPLRAFGADMQVTLKKLLVMDLQFTEVVAGMVGKNKEARSFSLNGKLNQGVINTVNRIEVGKNPRMTTKTSVAGLRFGEMLKSMDNKVWMSGATDLNVDLAGQGKTVGDLRKSLNGAMNFNVVDGAVEGFNLTDFLRRGQALSKGQSFTSTDPKRTKFSDLSGSATVKDGVLSNNDLNAANDLVSVAGRGTVNLYSEQVDYTATATLIAVPPGQENTELAKLRGVGIPVRCRGQWTGASCKADFGRVLENKAKQEIKKELDKVLEPEKKKIEDKLRKGLEGLFGR